MIDPVVVVVVFFVVFLGIGAVAPVVCECSNNNNNCYPNQTQCINHIFFLLLSSCCSNSTDRHLPLPIINC